MSFRVFYLPLLLLISVFMTYCPDATASEQPAAKSVIASLVGSGQRQDDESSLPPRVGKKARDFTLKTLDGKPVQLSKLTAHGPVVILVLRGWPGYQCPICTRQMGDFLAKAKEFEAEEASVVLVYPGPAENLGDHAKEFLGDKALPSPFLFVTDPDYAFTAHHKLRWDEPRETAYPSTFVLDRKGKVQFAKVSKTHAGRTSAKEVLAVVSSLKAGL
jgi:peroxiredoxin